MLRMLQLAAAIVAITLAPFARADREREVSIGLQAAITSIDPHFHNLSPNNMLARHVFGALLRSNEKCAELATEIFKS